MALRDLIVLKKSKTPKIRAVTTKAIILPCFVSKHNATNKENGSNILFSIAHWYSIVSIVPFLSSSNASARIVYYFSLSVLISLSLSLCSFFTIDKHQAATAITSNLIFLNNSRSMCNSESCNKPVIYATTKISSPNTNAELISG